MTRQFQLLADQAFARTAGAPLVGGNAVRLLKDGSQNYPAWLEAIRGAQHWIHFETYILHEDEIGCHEDVPAREEPLCSLAGPLRDHPLQGNASVHDPAHRARSARTSAVLSL